eukprot:CAMPEP_0118722280 /NCGR_PEP_ID=MMETSP0800-20121206/31267_1 /TAXON_ID=210618 ORGANISM="Striatella unipunctata, Strain CCMP2910" /NCGR_SAMPLE_ID=MMETSP0800 /ASSEMBLY_ACC=CAM_ASM_000638 /LENGTH=66 /DNA_ID=CAMNT_0006630391 /DNA_START=7 /DNA_END=203 /DNA_ORIENTATION=-
MVNMINPAHVVRISGESRSKQFELELQDPQNVKMLELEASSRSANMGIPLVSAVTQRSLRICAYFS